EDWQDEREWDNAVARITVEATAEVVDILKIWLSGEKLDNYSNLNKDYERVNKIATISN
ncbi:MAG: hypothetical protein F6K56_45745, partial [Moorea sp. SIO3G5]|nr:hypothetical protein [Moorena sp. SIO3G5]